MTLILRGHCPSKKNLLKRSRNGGMPVLKESDIARTCSDYLEADGWRMIITDPVSDRQRGKGFGELGMADRLYIRYPRGERTFKTFAQVLWIEWKRIDKQGKTTKATALQKSWHEAERARGALTWIAGEDFPASIEGFIEFYQASVLKRR
jgi:hypothetical protein